MLTRSGVTVAALVAAGCGTDPVGDTAESASSLAWSADGQVVAGLAGTNPAAWATSPVRQLGRATIEARAVAVDCYEDSGAKGCQNEVVAGLVDGTVARYATNGEERWKSGPGTDGPVAAVAAAGGHLIAAAAGDEVVLWDLQVSAAPARVAHLGAPVTALAFVSGGAALAAGTADGRVLAENLGPSGLGWVDVVGETGRVNALATVAADRRVAVANSSGTVRLVDGFGQAAKHEPVKVLDVVGEPVTAVASARDLVVAVAASQVWAVGLDGALRWHGAAPFGTQSVAASPDGALVAVGRGGATPLEVWSAADGRRLP